MSDAPQLAYDRAPPIAYEREQKYARTTETHFPWPVATDQVKPSPIDQKLADVRILGLRRRDFWILLVGLVIVVAATIGGSIGGALAVRSKNTVTDQRVPQSPTTVLTPLPPSPTASQLSPQSSSPTPTSTSALSIPNPRDVFKIDIACPQALQDYNGNAYDCTNNVTIPMLPGTVGDLTGMVAYNLQQCIDACGTFNQVAGNITCKAVVLISALSTQYTTNKGANCWLKKVGEGQKGAGGYTVARVRI